MIYFIYLFDCEQTLWKCCSLCIYEPAFSYMNYLICAHIPTQYLYAMDILVYSLNTHACMLYTSLYRDAVHFLLC